MKKSHKTYVLLALVLGIWGIIGFKIVNTINPEPKETVHELSSQKFKREQFKARDTFSIVADYRDPFLGTMPKSAIQSKRNKIAAKRDTLPEKNIAYTGYITESSSKKKIFFLGIDGHQQMMSVNETFKDVKLVSGDKQTVRVRYNGKTKNIPITQ